MVFVQTYATPLQQSTLTLRSDLTDYLLSCGADVAFTPLHQAAGTNNVKQIKRLLARWIPVDTLGESVDGVHLRMPCIGQKWWERGRPQRSCCKKARIQTQKTGWSHTIALGSKEQPRIRCASLSRVRCPAQCDRRRRPPVVCLAAEAEGVDAPIFSHLVAAGATLRTQVAGGNTALHIALQSENRQTALALIQCGSSMMSRMRGASGRRLYHVDGIAVSLEERGRDAQDYDLVYALAPTLCRARAGTFGIAGTIDVLDGYDRSQWHWRWRGVARRNRAIVCHGYTKSEWFLNELALAKLLRKPLLGLIVEDNPAAMASLEPLLPSRHRIRFNDFIVAKRDENLCSVVFEIDDAAFARLWQGIRPRLMSNLQEGAGNVLIPKPAPTSKRNKLSSLTI
ncbi:hypothetical protein PsorP6_008476 [Peronosclerospora sorghi]|uniref:Uncharacterized protein n=1 Tax=Peronosclerospora sorghi TaxID=230839 RepID=A0ACC0WAF4_9STRA|nr:hypothetical protein PsorP6_008476 [Peronosclerospora sorghi]